MHHYHCTLTSSVACSAPLACRAAQRDSSRKMSEAQPSAPSCTWGRTDTACSRRRRRQAHTRASACACSCLASYANGRVACCALSL